MYLRNGRNGYGMAEIEYSLDSDRLYEKRRTHGRTHSRGITQSARLVLKELSCSEAESTVPLYII